MQLIHSITHLVNQSINESHLDNLFELLYPKIKQLAISQLNKINPNQQLTPTLLVNECYLKLKQVETLNVLDRQHFFNLVAKSMRFFLIDLIRRENRYKRQGIMVDFNLSQLIGAGEMETRILDLNHAIDELKELDAELALLTELRFFAGLSLREIAKLKKTNLSETYKQWKLAKAMLTGLMDANNEQSE